MGFCEGWYFGRSCFVTDWVIKLLLYTEAGTRTNCSISKQMVIDGGVISLMSSKPLSDARMSLLSLKVVRSRDNSQTSLWNFTTWCLFMLCRFPLSRFIMHSQRNRINSFGQDWTKRHWHLWENDWNTWRVERICVFIVQNFWLSQSLRDIKLWGNGSCVCTVT